MDCLSPLRLLARYAKNEEIFFADFSAAFAKLIAVGCPPATQPTGAVADSRVQRDRNAEFRDQSMHGSFAVVSSLADKVDASEPEAGTLRTALHKAAFWGHAHLLPVLIDQCKIDVDLTDCEGDTALHDAARFGHMEVVTALLKAGANRDIVNKKGETAAATAAAYNKADIVRQLKSSM